jgi:hypothetical protein
MGPLLHPSDCRLAACTAPDQYRVDLRLFSMRCDATGLTYVWMWTPTLAVLLVQAVLYAVQIQLKQAIEAAHPIISEMHVNLSGRSLWLDPDEAANGTNGAVEMPGNDPAKFIAFNRYYDDNNDKMTAYDAARLADSFREMRVFYGESANTPPTLIPVRQPAAFPDLKTVINHLSFNGGEASVIKYWYYHYLDHVNVVPAISLSGSQSLDLWGSAVALVEFHIANLATQAIARLEIDGQTIDLGFAAFQPERSENSACTSRNFAAHAINPLDAPLKVRWQLAQANPAWHEATVVVPDFSPGKTPIAVIRSTSVDLYFQADGSVAAERSQFGTLPQGEISHSQHRPGRTPSEQAALRPCPGSL